MNKRIQKFLVDNKPATPCLVIDLDVVRQNYRAMRRYLPKTEVFYAVKANPAPEVFAFDSEEELHKISRAAPGQAVLDSAPATVGAAANFHVIPRRQQACSRAEIRMLVEQNDILQTCRLVTLGRGTAVDVPFIRRCPTCGELTSREGDLDSCKMS
ncbi:hypothetical protein J8273_7133 [Carpediemonas membranifera]|uniref:Ornithine decarboxylase n=1 Tax=Carpediemonas membranifera TaxID=201153 RepID=A0A8J6AQC8_9EUKA|nr:hypothetical protein J8273_7133 [Carpediemonas membranifera]|eukprot:KAG9390868.1 hypothetical protein J8273_7133 [Carpediemonas membranifera]